MAGGKGKPLLRHTQNKKQKQGFSSSLFLFSVRLRSVWGHVLVPFIVLCLFVQYRHGHFPQNLVWFTEDRWRCCFLWEIKQRFSRVQIIVSLENVLCRSWRHRFFLRHFRLIMSLLWKSDIVYHSLAQTIIQLFFVCFFFFF